MTSQLAALGRAIVLANYIVCFRLLVVSFDLDEKPSPTGTDLHYLMIMLLVLIPQYHHLLILFSRHPKQDIIRCCTRRTLRRNYAE